MGSSPGSSSYDRYFKVLLIGDSAVGKSSLLVTFVSPADHHAVDTSPTIGIRLSLSLDRSISTRACACGRVLHRPGLSRIPD